MYFFSVSPIKARVGDELHHAPIRCASIHLRGGGSGKNTQAGEYMPIPLTKDNKGWSSSWFYVKNHGEAPLPAFSGRFLTDKPPVWEYGPEKEEVEKLSGLLAAIKLLKNRGLTGASVVGANHKRRVAPILVRALPLDEMKPGAPADAVA